MDFSIFYTNKKLIRYARKCKKKKRSTILCLILECIVTFPALYIIYFRTKCDFSVLYPENRSGIIHNTYPWRRKCYPLQYSCLENPMDRGVWQATVLRVARVVHDLATKLLLLLL